MSDDGLDVVDSDDGGGGGSSFGNDTSYRRLARTRSTFNTARQADSDREMEGDELEPVVSDNDEDYSSDNRHNNIDAIMDANGNGVGVSEEEEDDEEEEEEEDMDDRGARPAAQNQGEPSMADRFAKYIHDLEDDARGWDANRLRGTVQDMRHQAMQHRHSWCSVTLPNEAFLSLLVAAETFVVKESMSVDSEMFRTLVTDIVFPVFDRVLREDRCTRREGPVLYMYCIRALLRLVVASIHARLDVLLTYHDTLGSITTLALNRNTPIYTLLDGYMQMLDPGMRYRNYVAYCCELTSYRQAASEGMRLPAGWSSYAVMLHGWSGVRVDRADEERRRRRGNWPLQGVAHLKAYVRAARRMMLDRQTAILAIAISPFSTLYHSLDTGVRMDVFGDVVAQCLSRLSAVVASPEQLCLGKLRGELLVNDVYHALLLIRPMCADKHSERLPCESALMAFLVRVLIESPFSVKMQAITTLQQMTSMENRIVDLCDLECEAKKHRLIEVMLRDNLHHAAYVDRLERVVVSLAPCLSEEDVDLLWKAQQADVHDAVKRNLHRVIGTVVPYLPHFRVELLFKLMTAEWACASERGRASLIELLRRMGCGSEVVKPELEEVCVRRLYEWSVGEDSSPATQQAAETAMCKLLEQQLFRGTDTLVMAYIQETCNIIKKDGEGVASAVSLLKHLLLLHPAQAVDGCGDVSVRAQLIRDVDCEFDLVSHLVAASGRMVEREQEKHVTGQEMSPSLVSSGLSLRLDLLRFVLAEGRQKMNEQHMRSLWHSQVECGAARWRCSLGFDLFAAALTQGLLDDATLASFYHDCVLSYPPSSLCPSAMSCLEVFFLHVNLLAGGLRMVDAVAGKEDGQEMSYQMQRADLMGTSYLWRVVCECVDGEVAASATRLFVRLHTRTSEALRKEGGSSGGGSSVQEDLSLSTSPSSASASASPSPTAGGADGMEECGAGADTTTPLSYAETVVNECMRRICDSSAPSSTLSGTGGGGGGGGSMLSGQGQGGERDEGVESAGEEEAVEGDAAREGHAAGVDRRERMRRLVKLLSLLVSSDDLCACLARRRRPPLARAMHGNGFVLVVKWPAEERSLTTRNVRDVKGEERLEVPVHTNTTLYEVLCQTARKTEYDMPQEVIQRLQMCRLDSGMVYRPDDLKCTLGELCVDGGVELTVRLRRTSDTEQDLSSLPGPDGRECLLMGAALSKHHTVKLLELAEQGCSGGGGEGETAGDADALINVLLAAPVDVEMERSVVSMAESLEIANCLPRMSPVHALYTVELLRSVFAPAGWTDRMAGGVRSYGQNATSKEELDEEWRKQCVLLRGSCVSGLIDLVGKCVSEAEEERRMEGLGRGAEMPSSCSRVPRSSRVSLRTRTLAAAIALLKQMLAVIARVRQQSLSDGPTTSTQARLFETIFLPHEGTLRKLCTVVAVRVVIGKEGSADAETRTHIHNMYKDKCAEQVVRQMLMIARQAAAVGKADEGEGGGEPSIVCVRVSPGSDECVDVGEGVEETRMCEQLAIDAMQVALLLQSWEDSAAASLLSDNEFASLTRCMLTANSRCIRSAGQLLAAHFCMAVATAGGHGGERAATECLRGWLDEREQLGADERAAIEYYRMVADVIRRFNEVSLPIPSVQSYYAHTMTWLREARDYTREHHVSYPDDNILLGHLQLAAHLASTLSRKMRESGGMGEDGRGVEWVGDILSEFCFAGCDESEQAAEGAATGATAPARSHTLQQMSSGLPLPRSVSAHVVPSRAAVNASVCGTVESRRAAFSLLVSLCADSHELLLEACHHLRAMFYRDDAVVRRDFDYQPEAAVRASADSYAGLKNGGATCYMNSIMQQLFMIPSLRHAVLQAAAEPGKGGVAEEGGGGGGEKTDKTEYCVQVLLAIQSMFAHLVGFELESHTPQLFWNTFKLNGSSLNVREQQDALEFYDQVVDLIDAALKRVGEPAAAAAIMGGEFADEKICKDCPHRFMKQEEFTSIALDVRSHNNLLDSLKEYVRGEILENDNAYHCDKCDKKVAAVKRLSIKRLPQVLVVQLKRFDFDWEKEQPVKFNDYFEFPMEVDMAPFTLEGLDAAAAEGGGEEKEDKEREQGKECGYRLRGVVVHSGQAGGGHYYSFIRADGDREDGAAGAGGEQKEKWFKFDDTDVTPFDATPDEVRSKWFGADEASVGEGGGGGGSGRRRRPHNWWNAYILFYEQISPVSPPCASPMATQEKCEDMKEEGVEGAGEENPLDATMVSVAEEPCEASTSGEGTHGREEGEGEAKEQWRACEAVRRRGSCSSDRSVCGVRDRLRAESASPLTKLHSRFSTMSLSRGMRDMPAHLEAMVRRENRKMAHERAQFSEEFFLLVDQLVDRTIKEAQAARHRGRDRGKKQFVELCVGGMELLSLFMVHTGLHATVALRTPSRMSAWLDYLSFLLSSCGEARAAVAARVLLQHHTNTLIMFAAPKEIRHQYLTVVASCVRAAVVGRDSIRVLEPWIHVLSAGVRAHCSLAAADSEQCLLADVLIHALVTCSKSRFAASYTSPVDYHCLLVRLALGEEEETEGGEAMSDGEKATKQEDRIVMLRCLVSNMAALQLAAQFNKDVTVDVAMARAIALCLRVTDLSAVQPPPPCGACNPWQLSCPLVSVGEKSELITLIRFPNQIRKLMRALSECVRVSADCGRLSVWEEATAGMAAVAWRNDSFARMAVEALVEQYAQQEGTVPSRYSAYSNHQQQEKNKAVSQQILSSLRLICSPCAGDENKAKLFALILTEMCVSCVSPRGGFTPIGLAEAWRRIDGDAPRNMVATIIAEAALAIGEQADQVLCSTEQLSSLRDCLDTVCATRLADRSTAVAEGAWPRVWHCFSQNCEQWQRRRHDAMAASVLGQLSVDTNPSDACVTSPCPVSGEKRRYPGCPGEADEEEEEGEETAGAGPSRRSSKKWSGGPDTLPFGGTATAAPPPPVYNFSPAAGSLPPAPPAFVPMEEMPEWSKDDVSSSTRRNPFHDPLGDDNDERGEGEGAYTGIMDEDNLPAYTP